MSTSSPSALLTYVAFHDGMAREHWQLFTQLQAIVRGSEPVATVQHYKSRLNEFLDLLAQHHETEDLMLRAVSPKNLQAHLNDHDELHAAARLLLQQLPDISLQDVQRQAGTILNKLTWHVFNMDHMLAQSIDAADAETAAGAGGDT